MGHLTYIFWLTIFIWIPIVLMLVIDYKYFLRYKKTLFYCSLSALVFSLPWDFWAIKTHVWYFSADKILGLWILGIPIEEYFFIIFIIFATVEVCLLTLTLKKFMGKKA